jgi:hypothetical protein
MPLETFLGFVPPNKRAPAARGLALLALGPLTAGVWADPPRTTMRMTTYAVLVASRTRL